MSHRPVNAWARQTGLIRIVTTQDYSEIIPDHLWQSGMPTDDMLKQIRPDTIINCCWFPDGPLPNMSQVSYNAEWVASQIRLGRRVLIHCQQGLNRSSLVTCLVLLRLNPTWTGPEAVRYLESKRPGVLTNTVFRQYLMHLQQQSADADRFTALE